MTRANQRAVVPGAVLAMCMTAVFAPTKADAGFGASGIYAFLAADTNGDQRLTASEFQVFVQQLANAGAAMPARIRAAQAYDAAFQQVDIDRDGTATAAEIAAAEAGN